MTSAQEKLLQKAKLDWMDQVFTEHEVPQWVLNFLKSDNPFSMGVIHATLWLELEGFQIFPKGPHHIEMLRHGKVISTFIFTP